MAIKEILRISKSGYLEVPDGLLETALPNKGHLWFIYLNDETLVFVRKSKKLHALLNQNALIFFPFFRLYEPFIRMYWKDIIKYKIIDELEENDKYTYNIQEKNTQRQDKWNYYFLLVKFLRKVYRIKNKNQLRIFK